MSTEPGGVQKVVGAVKEVAVAPAKVTLGFLAGFRYPFRGARFVYLQHPGLVRFWIVPILITAALLYGVFSVLGAHHSEWVDALWSAPTGDGFWVSVQRAAHAVVDWALTIVLGLLGLVVVAGLASIIAAPFNDTLSEEVELRVAGIKGPAFSLSRLFDDTVRTVRVELSKLAIYVAVMLPLFILQFLIPGLGAILYAVFGFLFTATFFAVDYVDWPASRRGLGARYRMSIVRSRFVTMLGFGTGVYLLLFVPLLNLFFMPAAVAGGTLLFLDIERDQPSPETQPPNPS